MLVRKLKHLAIGVSVFAMSCVSTYAATITVVVSPVAANAISDLIPDFQSAFSTSGYNVSVVVAPDGDAKKAIVAGGANGPYDLFLSQSSLAPAELQSKHSRLIVGSPFPFARDALVLYSNSKDISAGVPINLHALSSMSSPDPATLDPHGVAALEVLGWRYHWARSRNLVINTPDAGSSYAAVEYLGATFGFTGKSQICSAVTGVEEFPSGTFHHVYKYGVDYSEDIVLTGVKIARPRTTDENAELSDFINFLTGDGGVGLRQHCFDLPAK